MGGFLLRKAGAALVVLLLASMLVFLGVRAIPGDPAIALGGDSRRARRPLRAAFLARAADDRLVRRRSALAAGERLRHAAPPTREPRAHTDAVHRPRHRLRRRADAADALVDADVAWHGLRAHGAREGARRVERRLPARASQQPDHGD